MTGLAHAATLTVGPGKQYSMPCAAFQAAANGDTIEIDAGGNYSGNVCAITKSNLTIRGVNGRPKIDAAGQNSGGKGTWVVQGNDNTVDNVEMFGARVPDQNGAAIRLEALNFTLKNSYLHDNENGILTGNGGKLVVENSEFGNNGFGSGYTHNLYVGNKDTLIFTGNYTHDAKGGHNLKTRAKNNTITYNRITNTGSGNPSYEIDIPNAGNAYIIGNIIQQPSNHTNPGMLTFGVEGATNPGQELYVVNNTFINDDSSRGTFLFIGSQVTTAAVVKNNIFAGTGTFSTQGNTVDSNNVKTTSPQFKDRANYDLTPVATWSAVVNAGTSPGSTTGGLSLTPTLQYSKPATTVARPVSGNIDIGAIEYTGTVTTTPTPTPAPAPTPTPAPAPAPAPAPVVSPTPTVGFTNCAPEGGTCSFTGTRQVRYGANGSYAYKTATGSISCTNAVFGDPISGTVKACSYASTSTETAPTPTPTPSPTPTTWTNCAAEGSTCSFTGTMQVRYGANGSYAYKAATGSVSCTNAVFGDPIPGIVKSCQISGTTTTAPTPVITAPVITTPTWSKCAGEGMTCSFSGTKQVRYGANGSYAYKTATGAIACNNNTFGDPAFGVVKSCEVSSQ